MDKVAHRPMSTEDFKLFLESHAAAALLAWLRDQGHVIEDVHLPDIERKGRRSQHAGKTVDLTFKEDGGLVAVEIMELHESERHARQNAEVSNIARQLESWIGPRLRELKPGHSAAATWHVSWLPSGKALSDGLRLVQSKVLARIPGLQAGEVVEIDERPDFVTRLELQCWESPTPAFGFISLHEEQSFWISETAAGMAELLVGSSKPEQLAAYEDARVLAVDRALMPFAGELAAALDARRDRIPSNWTAVYFVIPGVPQSLSRVWSRNQIRER
jgi:hypothetical protein